MTTVQFTPAAKAGRIYSTLASLESGALLTVASTGIAAPRVEIGLSTDTTSTYMRLTLEEAHALAHELLKCIDAVEVAQ